MIGNMFADTFTTFLSNLTSGAGAWVRWIAIIIGLVLFIFAIYKTAKGLMSQGRGQENWAITILMYIIGGVLIATGGGFDTFKKITNGFNNDIQSMATNSGLSASRPQASGDW